MVAARNVSAKKPHSKSSELNSRPFWEVNFTHGAFASNFTIIFDTSLGFDPIHFSQEHPYQCYCALGICLNEATGFALNLYIRLCPSMKPCN